MYNYCVYNNLFWIFFIQLECPSAKHAQSYGRAGRVRCISLQFNCLIKYDLYIYVFVYLNCLFHAYENCIR